ncbi:hypothetical protein AHAS_Ahas10G0202500 [Arachis hypogaea]
MQIFPIFHLTSLDSEDCWSLLANSSERSNLEGIGREIVKKCDGLPLAAVALGGLLRTILSKNDWNKGKLCISKLQKMVDLCDASQANMKKKEKIEDLSLEWDSCTAQESQHLVLEHLQPSTNLKKLTIKFYGGTWFPNWLDNRNIINASNLFSELMLGLNSLEQLHIEGIPSRTAIPRDGLPETC